jgi:hypothetical protein
MGIAGPVTDGQKAQLERIRASCGHLLMLVDDVLDLAKIEADRVEVAFEPGRIGEPVQAAISLLALQAEARGLEVHGSIGHPEAAYVGDEDRIRQILVNLLSNAIKFTEPGGTITIMCDTVAGRGPGNHLRGEGPWVRVCVEDTGVGIPPEQAESVFEPFVQVETGWTRSKGGTGLGLAISRRLARLMGGDLLLESDLGVGSRFTLWLPGAQAAGERDAEVPALTPQGEREGAVALPEIGEIVQAHTAKIAESVSRRLHGTPALQIPAPMSDAELNGHLPALLSAMGQVLVVLGRARGNPELVRESAEIRRLLAEKHGEQRARLGWSEAALQGERDILRQEIDSAITNALAPEAGSGAMGKLLDQLVEQAWNATLRGWRRRQVSSPAQDS